MKIALIRKQDQTTPDWVPIELQAAGFELIDRACRDPDEVVKIATDADIVWDMGGVETITAEILPLLPRCGAIIRGGSGTDNIPVSTATELGIIVANTPDATAIPVAEHAVGLILAMTRKIPMQESAVRNGMWDPNTSFPLLLYGKTVGLVGFGRIARGVAERLRAFGVDLAAFDPEIDSTSMEEIGVTSIDLENLLLTADIVSVHTPLLPSTHHLIGPAELERMKPTAILINTSRGSVVDTRALADAIAKGTIAGAGLDVLEQEPPDKDPLIGLPNVVITPHSASYHALLMEEFCRLSVDTIQDLAHKRWPMSYVNIDVQPRWDMPPRKHR